MQATIDSPQAEVRLGAERIDVLLQMASSECAGAGQLFPVGGYSDLVCRNRQLCWSHRMNMANQEIGGLKDEMRSCRRSCQWRAWPGLAPPGPVTELYELLGLTSHDEKCDPRSPETRLRSRSFHDDENFSLSCWPGPAPWARPAGHYERSWKTRRPRGRKLIPFQRKNLKEEVAAAAVSLSPLEIRNSGI